MIHSYFVETHEYDIHSNLFNSMEYARYDFGADIIYASELITISDELLTLGVL